MSSFTGSFGYSAEIIADRAIKTNSYIKIPNRTIYKIKLENTNRTKCKVNIYIDNQKCGSWNIEPYSSGLVERPANINKLFYFAQGTYNKMTDSNYNIGQYKNSVITIDFIPDKDEQIKWPYPKICQDTTPTQYRDYKNTSHGLINNTTNTINGSFMKYPFGSPSVIPNYHEQDTKKIIDYYNETMNTDIKDKITIKLRLVVDEEYEKPFIKTVERKPTNIPIDQIPKVRQYEDYFLINRFNPYE